MRRGFGLALVNIEVGTVWMNSLTSTDSTHWHEEHGKEASTGLGGASSESVAHSRDTHQAHNVNRPVFRLCRGPCYQHRNQKGRELQIESVPLPYRVISKKGGYLPIQVL